MHTTDMNPDTASIGVSAPKRILQSVLAALNEGKIAKAVDQFDDRFSFSDHALDLEFTDKGRLDGRSLLLRSHLLRWHRHSDPPPGGQPHSEGCSVIGSDGRTVTN